MNLKPGTTLHNGSYTIIETIGHGGFGVTYRAEQVMAHRNVCIKEFFPKDYYKRDDDTDNLSLLSQGHADMMDRLKRKFIKEAQTIASLDHAHIIHIYDVFEENGTAYYTMEYIEGKSLNEIIKERGALREDEANRYIQDVASALKYIHDRNINHLDVKPGNIMVRAKDDNVILIDFGLSKHYNAAGDQTSSTPVGISVGYAPIEQYQVGGLSEFSPMTDIYALGATLYYLVTATVPPQATSIGERGLPELPAHLSDGMRQAISRAMQYWRKDRPQNIDEFLALLDDQTAAMAFIPMDRDRKSNSSPKSDEPKPKKQSRRIGLWILLLILLIIIGTVVVLSLGGKEGATQHNPQNINMPEKNIKVDTITPPDSTRHKDEPGIKQDSTITAVPIPVPIPAAPELILTSANDVTIKPQGEKVKFKFEITNPISDAEIEYGTYEEWIEIEDIKIDQDSGDKISYIGYYTVPQNDSDKPRADNIVVTYCEQSFNIIVRQFPVATLTLSTNSINVSAEGGNEIINYSVGGTTKSVDVTQYYDWVKITHVGNDTIHLTIDPNPSSSPRNNTIKVTCGDIVKSIEVKQNARTAAPVLILKSNAIIAAPAGESIEIGYTIENPIPNGEITTSKPDAWATISSISDNSIKLNVAENSQQGARDTKFEVYYNGVAYPITVHQESNYVEVTITYKTTYVRDPKAWKKYQRRCRGR